MLYEIICKTCPAGI